MRIARRDFIKLLGAATIGVTPLARALADAPAGSFGPVLAGERDPVAHVIARLTYGTTPALLTHVGEIGTMAFIEEQLNPETLDDTATDRLLAEFDVLRSSAIELVQEYDNQPGEIVQQYVGSTMLRNLYSERQLYERMVEFWNNHFSTYLRKGPTLFLKPVDDREVIRPHALGRFRDLLGAVAHSPSMLVYLDNLQNTAAGPNENFSRELMELHTLGVGGGYTEADVKAVAAVFTGWSIVAPRREDNTLVNDPGTFVFRPRLHVAGEKVVLGQAIPPSGEREGEAVLDILASHPSTARFISTKLVRRFVADNPPPELVESCTAVFLQTDGDIGAVLRVIFNSQDFWNAAPKFKQPYEHTIGTMRAMAFDVTDWRRFNRVLGPALQALGQVPFHRPSPDGYPDVATAWMGNLLPRWNLAIGAVSDDIPGAAAGTDALLNMLEAANVPFEPEPVLMYMASYLFGRLLTDSEETVMMEFARSVGEDAETQIVAGLALLMASPAYQYR